MIFLRQQDSSVILHYRCRFDADLGWNIDIIKFRFRHKAPQGWQKYYLLVSFIFAASNIIRIYCNWSWNVNEKEGWCLVPAGGLHDQGWKEFLVLWGFCLRRGETFVVISRLETRMSIRLMDILNGSKEGIIHRHCNKMREHDGNCSMVWSRYFPHLQIGTQEEPFELLVKPLQHSLTVRIFGIIWKRNWKIKHNTSPEYKTNNLGYFALNKVRKVLPLCPAQYRHKQMI